MLLPSRPSMVSVVVCLVLGLVLVAAAGLKAVGGASARAALATYGIRRGATAVWGARRAVEAVLGVLVGAGLPWALNAAALFVAAACAAQVAALAAGRAGRPCACFGARGRLSSGSAGRAALLAAALALAPILPRTEPTTDG